MMTADDVWPYVKHQRPDAGETAQKTERAYAVVSAVQAALRHRAVLSVGKDWGNDGNASLVCEERFIDVCNRIGPTLLARLRNREERA